MKYIILLAFKNLFRYRRRTIITAGAIAYGLGMFIMMDGMLLVGEKDSERHLFEYETGSAQIYAEGYWKERDQLPQKYYIQNPYKIIESLRKNGIKNATPRITISCEILNENSGASEIAILNGIDPIIDDDVFGFKKAVKKGNTEQKKQAKKNKSYEKLKPSLIEGKYLKKGDEGIMLGGWLAEDLGLNIGDFVTISFNMRPVYDSESDTWLQSAMTADEYEIKAFLKTGNPMVNRGYIYMDIAFLDTLVEAEGGATSIVLRVPENSRGDKLLKKAESISLESGCELYSWKEIVKSYLALVAAKRGGSFVILFLIALIAAVGISNTMMMSVIERKREIGMMRAMGMEKKSIMFMFLLEAGGIGVLGAIGGLMIGALANLYMTTIGIPFGFMLREFDVGYRIADNFMGAWNPSMMLFGALFTILITAIFAYLPARKSLKQEIPETLRVE